MVEENHLAELPSAIEEQVEVAADIDQHAAVGVKLSDRLRLGDDFLDEPHSCLLGQSHPGRARKSRKNRPISRKFLELDKHGEQRGKNFSLMPVIALKDYVVVRVDENDFRRGGSKVHAEMTGPVAWGGWQITRLVGQIHGFLRMRDSVDSTSTARKDHKILLLR